MVQSLTHTVSTGNVRRAPPVMSVSAPQGEALSEGEILVMMKRVHPGCWVMK